MGAYGAEYPHFQYCIERAGKPSRRIYDVLRHTLPLLGSVKKGDRVLDVGCGIGEFGHDLNKLGLQTVSFDMSLYAQQKGVLVFGKENSNSRVVGNTLDLPFPDKSFDMVTSWDLLEHLTPDQIKFALGEFKRVAKGNKIFIKLTPTEDAVNIDKDITHITKWNERTWEEWFQRNGLATLGNPTRHIFGKTTHGNFLLEKI